MENQGNCAICELQTTKSCGQCKKVYYCCKEHQVAHRREHKEDCYAAEIKFEPRLGYYMVATKDIPQGEIIFKEKPLLLSPSGNLKNLKKICLSCCDLVKDCNTCSKCKWPVCNSECENAYQHAKFECQLLAGNKISRPKLPHEFEVVSIIRCVLLKSLKPEKWEKLMTLLPKIGVRFSKKEEHRLHYKVETAHKILTELCEIQDVDVDTVSKVCSILNRSTQFYGRLANETGLQLYYKGSKIIQECTPNVRIFDVEPEFGGRYDGKVPRTPLFQIKLMATNDIKKGDILKRFFEDSVLGTVERRAFLKDEYNYECFCRRCSDSTELNTYVSAVRCTSLECRNLTDRYLGFFLPIEATNENALWRCNKCGKEVPYFDDIFRITSKISDSANAVLDQVTKFNELPDGNGLVNAAMCLDSFINRHCGPIAHSNHYLLIPVKIQFLSQMYNFLVSSEYETNLYAAMSNRMSEIALEVLQVVSNIFPGMTVIRGKILFYLTTSRWHTMKWNMKKVKDYFKFLPAVQDLSKLKNEAQTILCLEPIESIENAMGSALSNIDLFNTKYSDNLLKQEIVRLRRT